MGQGALAALGRRSLSLAATVRNATAPAHVPASRWRERGRNGASCAAADRRRGLQPLLMCLA
eukprot:350719-Pyramimonas_sp.AAC.1